MDQANNHTPNVDAGVAETNVLPATLPQWREVRCSTCNKLLLKVIGQPTDEELTQVAKFGIHVLCRRCKTDVYRTIVI